MKAMLATAIAVLAIAGAPASAQSLTTIRAIEAGQVGERYDGYLGYVATPSPELRRQITSINIERRSLYTQLAGSKGVSPQDVGITAGCQLLARVGVGGAYMWADGVWRRRSPGQPAPVPNYCR